MILDFGFWIADCRNGFLTRFIATQGLRARQFISFLKPAFFAFGGLTLLFFLSGCSRDEVPAPPQALLSELVRKDGRLHRAGESEPFTGVMLEHYPDGTLKSRSELVEGVLHGVSEGWHPNKVLQVREHFVAGVSHGARSRWYADGARRSEAEIIEGQIHGVFRRWHENGKLAEEIEMKHGRADGISLSYFPSGYIKAYAEMEEGEIVEREFWNDGETLRPLLSEAGEFVGE